MTSAPCCRRWLHLWAVLTAAAVFILLVSGGNVTSYRAGMADPNWPSPPWYMLVMSWAEASRNFLIEHSHRQIGWVVGILAMVLAAWQWFSDSRPTRWLGVVALVGVGLQGILGGLRVRYEVAAGLELAMLHGFFGQLLFCLLVLDVLVTSRSWQEDPVADLDSAGRFQRLCRLTTILLLVQLALGVLLRQAGMGPGYSILIAHAVFALAVLGHAVMLAVRVFKPSAAMPCVFKVPAGLLGLLVLLQTGLGVGVWWIGGGKGAMSWETTIPTLRSLLATTHVGLGALVLATSVVLTLRSYRQLASGTACRPATKDLEEPMVLTGRQAVAHDTGMGAA